MSLQGDHLDFSLLQAQTKEPLSTSKSPQTTRTSNLRWVFLVLACFNCFGSFFCFDNPQALETELEKAFDLSNFQFNLLYSVYSFPNIILPFFGGLMVDKLGVRVGIFLFSFLLIIGQAVFTLGAAKLNFIVMLIGRTIFGFGGESLNVASSVITAKWFMGKELSFSFGASLCVARLGSSLNSFLSPKLFTWTNQLYVPLLLGVVFCAISWILGILMNIMDKKADLEERSQGRDEYVETISLKDFKEFTLLYYLILLNGFFLYGGYNGLNNNLNDLMVERFGFTPDTAGNFIPIVYIIAAIIIPFFGIYVDYKGKRAFLMIFSVLLFFGVHLSIAFLQDSLPDTTNYAMIGPLVGTGIFYATYAAIYWACIPLVVNKRATGTAFGIAFASQNLMLTVIPMILGAIHDKTKRYKEGYFWTEITLAGLVLCGLIITIWIYKEDLRTGRKLDRPSTQKYKESFAKSRAHSFINV